MAEENKGQEPEKEQEPVQGEEPAQEQAPEENPQKDEPEKEKGEGLLMPILYALLAAVGAFTLIMIIGIVVTFFTRPAQPSETPSGEPSQSTQAPVRAWQPPDGEGSQNEIPLSFL